MNALAAALAELRDGIAAVAHVEQRTWTGALANKTSTRERVAAYRREREAWAVLDAMAAATQPIAWESALQPFFRSFITDERYQRLGPKFKPWYRPYRCASCTRSAAAAPHDSGDSIETSEREAVEPTRQGGA